ncbi:hypothetical protein HAX54_014111 [Datura stramonium]|uniref:Uncharacterized protein n=1 Tax=Datura stramonium TaxID=4076 RepID=A0ABS8RYS3_DATST|nr:hypothetical protein [Datura stramonium]
MASFTTPCSELEPENTLRSMKRLDGVRFSNDQLREIALALNAAKCPFILVAKEQDKANQLEEKDDNYGDWWQVDGFKELVVNNKSSDYGHAVITWPLFAEQFYNQKLLELLGLAIGVGSDVWNSGSMMSSPVVPRGKIELAIERLMYDSEESRKIRANVKLMAEKVKSATEGGSLIHISSR